MEFSSPLKFILADINLDLCPLCFASTYTLGYGEARQNYQKKLDMLCSIENGGDVPMDKRGFKFFLVTTGCPVKGLRANNLAYLCEVSLIIVDGWRVS